MKIYIAGAYVARDAIADIVVPVFNGHEIVSHWLFGSRAVTPGTIGTSPDRSDEQVTKAALKDLEEVASADAFVMLASSYLATIVPLGTRELDLHTGGRHVEMGFALARGIPVIIVGDPENIFARTLSATCVDTPASAVDLLRFAVV